MTFSVAIVGLGPKGLYSLESLVDAATRTAPGTPLRVDIFEPHETPGAGPVYDPIQPAYLTMNYSADQIDMWRAGERDPRRRSFVQWWKGRHGEAPPAFPPRADVGRYLSHGFDLIRGVVPTGMELRLVRGRALALHPAKIGWEVEFSPGPDRRPRGRRYDEVLITTGHETHWAGGLAAEWSHRASLVPAVFPTISRLTGSCVPPGTTVAVRGFGLTFIDAALALTEGRGGRFEPTTRLDRLRYVREGSEPRLILPFSRSGRPTLAKPDPGRFVNLEPIIAPHVARLVGAVRRPDVDADLLPAIVAVAADLLARDADMPAAAMDGLREMVFARLERVIGDDAPRYEPVEDELRRSVAVGMGLAPVDGPAALGQSWRSLYPAVVRAFSHAGLGDRGGSRFLRLAAGMERLSFGPPCENAAKLLALIDAGIVDLAYVSGGRVESDQSGSWLVSATDLTSVDVVVDAVLPPAGVPAGGRGITQQIVRDGHARLVAGGRGIDVRADGACIGVDGSVTPGLSAVGRPTEDAVIGNDTLSRRLHHHPELWAERIVHRLKEASRYPEVAHR